jgi:hypothetical protein
MKKRKRCSKEGADDGALFLRVFPILLAADNARSTHQRIVTSSIFSRKKNSAKSFNCTLPDIYWSNLTFFSSLLLF